MAKIIRSGNILSNLGIILLFLILSLAYFYPQIEGKVLQQSDIVHFKGMSKELVDHRDETGEEAIWTNTTFGGMPGYMISVVYPNNLAKYIHLALRKSLHPAGILFLYLLGFFVLLGSLKVKRWLAVVGAIAFGFSSYFLIIIEAGHNSKAYAIGYLPFIIAGVLLAYRKKYFAGSILFSLALAFEILAGHLQIAYYGFLVIVLYAVIKLVYAIRANELQPFFKASLFLLVGGAIALGMNFSQLYTSWEYSKETIRGPSELTNNDENKTSGLDKDYVVQWSYGIDETLTLLIPQFKGGASLTTPDVGSETYQTMQQRGVQNPRQVIREISMYHGEQPSTAGPVYIGAIVVFLFLLGIFVVSGPLKWWLVISTVISIVLSWGGNIMPLTSFLLDYLPFYNKFRAPSMTLVIAEIAMPLLGFIALNKIITGKADKKKWLHGLKWSAIITGGLTLVFAIMPGIAGDFTMAADAMRYPEWLMDSIISDRKDLLRADAFRSLIFIALAAGALYMWHLNKLKTTPFIAIIGVLILIDLWAVDKRYLNSEDFVSKRQSNDPFPITTADKAILQDQGLSYRVLPLQNPWQDARTSFYHKNVGGYHAAKLRRYQELITYHLQPEVQQMVQRLQSGTTAMDSVFNSLEAINMMNTRYVIYDLNNNPLYNPRALGNAWPVNNFRLVESADEEIEAMNNFDPQTTAVIDKRFAEHVQGKTFSRDQNSTIELTEYQPNYLNYSYNSGNEQLVVFSEIYYDKGWKAFIDGKETPHFRANYVLRAMVVPAGEHTIEFKFEPGSFYTGNKVALASSILMVLAVGAFGFTEFKKRNKL